MSRAEHEQHDWKNLFGAPLNLQNLMITHPEIDIARLKNFMQYVPYDVTPGGLYTPATLYAGYSLLHPETFHDTYDQQVYRYFIETGKIANNPYEALARSLHDHFVTTALYELLGCYEPYKIVGVMGGSAMSRTDDAYRQIVMIAKQLTEDGSLMVNGGGPGAMEACCLGGRLAGRNEAEVADALRRLAAAPSPSDPGYIDCAFEVADIYPQNDYETLSIPTWFYGHEPTTPFATHIAKLFTNSVREDLLLTISFGGVIYTPGSAGTMQEIFQEAVQNHYLTYGIASPMVFVGKKFWTEDMPAFTMLHQLSASGRYRHLQLALTDDTAEAVSVIKDFQQSDEAHRMKDKFGIRLTMGLK